MTRTSSTTMIPYQSRRSIRQHRTGIATPNLAKEGDQIRTGDQNTGKTEGLCYLLKEERCDSIDSISFKTWSMRSTRYAKAQNSE